MIQSQEKLWEDLLKAVVRFNLLNYLFSSRTFTNRILFCKDNDKCRECTVDILK